MALDDSSPRGVRPRYDDDDDLCIAKKPSGSSTTLFVVLTVGGISVVLLAAVIGIAVFGAIGFFANSPADKLPGSWKTRFVIEGNASDHIYTFRKDGTFREEAFNLQGVRTNVADGRWRLNKDEIEIVWNQGGFEIATARFVDNNTVDYRIVDHNDPIQIGMNVTLRRL